MEDLGSQGSGSSLITDHGSRILDRRPLAEQKTTSEQVWTTWGVVNAPKSQGYIYHGMGIGKCIRMYMVAWEIVLGDDAKSFRKPTKTRGPEPYGSPFGNPLPSLL